MPRRPSACRWSAASAALNVRNACPARRITRCAIWHNGPRCRARRPPDRIDVTRVGRRAGDSGGQRQGPQRPRRHGPASERDQARLARFHHRHLQRRRDLRRGLANSAPASVPSTSPLCAWCTAMAWRIPHPGVLSRNSVPTWHFVRVPAGAIIGWPHRAPQAPNPAGWAGSGRMQPQRIRGICIASDATDGMPRVRAEPIDRGEHGSRNVAPVLDQQRRTDRAGATGRCAGSS